MIENPQHGNVVQLDSGESELDLRKYLAVLLKHKWSIIGIALMAALIGLYLALRAVPIYEGSARLQIQRDTSAAAFSDGYSRLAFSAEFYKTQYGLIRCWGVAEMAAQRLGILEQPPPPMSMVFSGVTGCRSSWPSPTGCCQRMSFERSASSTCSRA